MTLNVAIASVDTGTLVAAQALGAKLNLPLVEPDNQQYPYLLIYQNARLELKATAAKAPGPIFVDFLQGALAHRRRFGGGELLARAVGLQQGKKLVVLDATAGLGRDGFILATKGCSVTLLERSRIVAALLEDGLKRALQDEDCQTLKINLKVVDAMSYLRSLAFKAYPDVIYLDPMFPPGQKSALVKKEMRILRDIVGEDADAKELLKLSIHKVRSRVVVKRARLAPRLLEGFEPDIVYKGQRSRFDVYLSSV